MGIADIVGRVSGRKPSPEEIESQVYAILIADGFNYKEAVLRLERMKQRAGNLLNLSESQGQLERIISSKDEDRLGEIIPMLLAHAEFPIDEESLIRCIYRVSSGLVDIMRFADIWVNRIPKSRLDKLVDVVTYKKEENLLRYADTAQRNFPNSGQLITNALASTLPTSWLPVYSALPLTRIIELSEEAQSLGELFKDTIYLDGIHSVRHVDQRIGICVSLDILHRITLVEESSYKHDKYFYGAVVLIYVRGVLVGSLKMTGEKSIIGLRTICDSEGKHPMVLGGAYAANLDVIDLAEQASKENKGEKWASLYLDNLHIYPLRFAYFSYAMSSSRRQETFDSILQYAQGLKEAREGF